MDLVITKVEKQKKNKQRYSIYINEEFAFGVQEETLIQFSLFKGTLVTNELVKSIQQADEVNRLMEVAIFYLSSQMRSERDVRVRLGKVEESTAESIDCVIEKLKEKGYIDDKRYSEAYIQTGATVSRKGPVILAMELKRKGVLQEWIVESIAAHYSLKQQFENALYLANQYKKKQQHRSLKDTKQRLYVHLRQKGFQDSLIQATLARVSFEEWEESNPDRVAHQAKNALRRLSNKYNGKELKYKLKSALYQKGFDMEEIDAWIYENEWEFE